MESKEVFVGFLFKNPNGKIFYGCKKSNIMKFDENIKNFIERTSSIINKSNGSLLQLAVYESESAKWYCGPTSFGGMKYTLFGPVVDDVYFGTKTPMFPFLNEKYFGIITTGDSISISYDECNLIKQYPELIEKMILPIEENMAKSQTYSLFDFIINTLNINFHPDDKFEDYLSDNNIIDIDGKILEFDEASLKYMEAQIGLCFEYADGDYDIYEIGMDIIMPRIQPAPKN